MKRNWELVRKILIKLEQQAEADGWLASDDVQGFDAETVAYHIKMLHQAKLIEAVETGGIDRFDYTARALTWEGREFLDKIRKDTVWNKVKTTAKEKGVELSFEVIKLVAGKVIEVLK